MPVCQALIIFLKQRRKMAEKGKLSASMEDYLEAIYHIAREKGASRAKDIATRLGVNSASVTGALRLLAEKGHINYAPYDVITLTQKGENLAKDIVRRHEILKDFFTRVLDVDEEEAEVNACKMEHAVSPTLIDRLVRFVEFVLVCPRGGGEWISGFKSFCNQDGLFSGCGSAIERCMEDLKKRQLQCSEAGKKIITLKNLSQGEMGRIIKIGGQAVVTKKFDQLNITPGSIIEREDDGSIDGEVRIKSRGYHLKLRKDDASKIELEAVAG